MNIPYVAPVELLQANGFPVDGVGYTGWFDCERVISNFQFLYDKAARYADPGWVPPGQVTTSEGGMVNCLFVLTGGGVGTETVRIQCVIRDTSRVVNLRSRHIVEMLTVDTQEYYRTYIDGLGPLDR